jgi:hypothetical protein
MKKLALAILLIIAIDAHAGPGIGIAIDANSLTGNGSSSNTLGLRRDCNAGRVLQWNGSQWNCVDGATLFTLVTSSDFTGLGTMSSPLDLSSNVSVPGIMSVAGTSGTTSLTVSSTTADGIVSTRTATNDTTDGKSAVFGLATGTFDTTTIEKYAYGLRGESLSTRASGANVLNNWGGWGRAAAGQKNIGLLGWVTASAGGTDDAGILGLSDSTAAAAYGIRGNARGGATVNYGVYGIATGGGTNYAGYFDTGLFRVQGLSTFNDDATFEAGTCVINSAGITCGGTLITPGADITSVTANSPLSGGGTSGAVTIGMANGDRGDITTTTGAQTGDTWTVDPNTITYAKMQDVSATSRFLGRITAGAGDPEELTGTQATTLLDTFSTAAATKGLVPGSSGGGASVFLNGNGAWTTPAGAGDITDVNVSATSPITSSSSTCSSGACSTTISTSISTARFVGRTTAGTGVMEQLTGTQATALLDQASTVATTQGVVPGSNGQTTKFLRGDMTWQTVSAGITNSASANYYAKSDGTNVVNGTIKDDGTSVTFNTTAGGSTAKVTITSASGNTNIQGTLDVAGVLTVANGSTGIFKDNSQHEKKAIINHITAFGSAPTITSGCGTGGTITGGDLAGKLVTGTSATTCVLTFTTAWTTAPNCYMWDDVDNAAPPTTTTTTMSRVVAASRTYRYICAGY